MFWVSPLALDLIGVDGELGVWWLPEWTLLGEDDPETYGRFTGEALNPFRYYNPIRFYP